MESDNLCYCFPAADCIYMLIGAAKSAPGHYWRTYCFGCSAVVLRDVAICVAKRERFLNALI